jgi:hypothetical protein
MENGLLGLFRRGVKSSHHASCTFTQMGQCVRGISKGRINTLIRLNDWGGRHGDQLFRVIYVTTEF